MAESTPNRGKLLDMAEGMGTVGKGIAGAATAISISYAGLNLWAQHITAKQGIFLGVSAVAAVIAILLTMWHIINEIRKQVYNNGGSTFRDQIERRLDLISAQLRVATLTDEIVWQHAEIASYRCGPDGRCVAVNDALCRLFGLTREQMLGHGWASAIPDQAERMRVVEAYQFSLAHKMPYLETYRIRNVTTGQEYYVQTNARSSYNPSNGDLDGCVGVAKIFNPDAHRRVEDRV